MKTLCRIIPVLLACLFLGGCGQSSPERLVKKELESIKKLDQETIENFISYEDITKNQTLQTDVGVESVEAVKLFFQNFSYKIKSSKTEDDSAYVSVEITNLDAKALAKDLCLTLLTRSLDPGSSEDYPLSINDYFSVLGTLLKEKTYDTVTTDAHFELVHLENGWSIQSSENLEDELVGGLITYLNDPFLLTPEENARAVLDMMKGFTANDWSAYLDLNDIFATGSEYYQEVDQSLASQIASCFDYTIVSAETDENGTDATVDVTVTSLDLSSVLDSFREKLVEYASTTESLRDSYTEQTNQTALYLKEALDENQASADFSTTITFHNDGSSWEMMFADDFSSILLGGSTQAISEFSSGTTS